MHRYLLSLAYDGGDFSGWWRQPGRRTVEGELDRAFSRIGEPHAESIGVARTTKGTCPYKTLRLSPLWLSIYHRATQRTRMFIGWVRHNLQSERPLSALVAALKARYGHKKII